jgi:hypothetical protein
MSLCELGSCARRDLKKDGLVYRLAMRGRSARRFSGRTSSCVESLAAPLAFEMLRLLMGDEKFEVLKIALACNMLECDTADTHAGDEQ